MRGHTHDLVAVLVENDRLGFTSSCLQICQAHDHGPEFLVRLEGDPSLHLILETKNYDIRKEVKAQAAKR